MKSNGSTNGKERVKSEIITALRHPEAEEGLYFRNFTLLHEEDERDPVQAGEVEILDALKELIEEGRVVITEGGDEAIFMLNVG